MRYLAALALLLLPLQAHADVSWDFIYTSVPAAFISLTVTDQAFRSGGLNLSWGECSDRSGQVPCSKPAQGDFSQIVSLSPITDLDQISATEPGHGTIDLSFSADGSLSAHINQSGENSELFLADGSGWVSYGGWVHAYFDGYWQLASPLPAAVPEPASLACLLAGLVGVGLGARRRGSNC